MLTPSSYSLFCPLLTHILLFIQKGVVKMFLFLVIKKFSGWSPPEWGVFISRGDLRICSTQGPRALKNVVGYGCVLDALLFIRTNEDREEKTHCLLLHLRAVGALHLLILDKLHAHLMQGPTSHEAIGPGLLCLCLKEPLLVNVPVVNMCVKSEANFWCTLFGNLRTDFLC